MQRRVKARESVTAATAWAVLELLLLLLLPPPLLLLLPPPPLLLLLLLLAAAWRFFCQPPQFEIKTENQFVTG